MSGGQSGDIVFGGASGLSVYDWHRNQPTCSNAFTGQNTDRDSQCPSGSEGNRSDGQHMTINSENLSEVSASRGDGIPAEAIPVENEVTIGEDNPVQMNSDNGGALNPPSTAATGLDSASDTDGYIYSVELLGYFASLATAMAGPLGRFRIPIDPAAFRMQNPQCPFRPGMRALYQAAFEVLLDILERATNTSQQSTQMDNTIADSEESSEIAETRVTELPEQPMNIHSQIQQETPAFESDAPPDALLTSCLHLLSNAQQVITELAAPVQLSIGEQPEQFWRNRYMNCLEKNWCAFLQGRGQSQRSYMTIKWSEVADCSANDMFVLIQLLWYNDQPHPTKVVVPPETKVQPHEVPGQKRKRKSGPPKLDDLIISNTYAFDKDSRSMLYPVTSEEFTACQKRLPAFMFSLDRKSTDIIVSEEAQTNENDASITQLLLRLCKLRMVLCRRTPAQVLQFLSNFVVTELIEESKGTEELRIDANSVTPQMLHNCGNEKITVQLNTDSEKNGFIVRLNDVELAAHEFRGVKDKKISFMSPPNRAPLPSQLRVQVWKQNIRKTVEQGLDPYEGLYVDELLDVLIHYVASNNNPHQQLIA